MKDWTHERYKPGDWDRRSQFRFRQVKLDGHRLTFFKQPDGRLVAYGRDAREDLEYLRRFPKLDQHPIVDAMRLSLPRVSSVDCEIWAPGRPASSVPTALRDPTMLLCVTAFAVPWYAGSSMARQGLEWANSVCSIAKIPFAAWDGHVGETAEDLMRMAQKTSDCEGWVLKNYNYDQWVRIKGEATVDAVVTGATGGNGKYMGQIGALLCSVYRDGQLVEIAKAGGMSDDQRDEMTTLHEKQQLVGRVVELKYQYVGAGGRLRHPRFKRWRDDKPAAECLWTQLDAAGGEA